MFDQTHIPCRNLTVAVVVAAAAAVAAAAQTLMVVEVQSDSFQKHWSAFGVVVDMGSRSVVQPNDPESQTNFVLY